MTTRDAAFTAFVEARRDHLRRTAYAVCGDWHRADDLVQTALVKLYAAWPRVRRAGSEEAYARTIIVRAAIDEARRPWRRERPTDELPDRAEPDAPYALDAREHDELFEALQRLPAMQRSAVVLRHWLGLSVEETAATLRIGEGTVKSHTSRGLSALRTSLQITRP